MTRTHEYTSCMFNSLDIMHPRGKESKKFFGKKKQERLEQEISNDLSEEYPNHDDSTEFIDWVEEMQLDDDIAKKRQLR